MLVVHISSASGLSFFFLGVQEFAHDDRKNVRKNKNTTPDVILTYTNEPHRLKTTSLNYSVGESFGNMRKQETGLI